MSVLDITQLRTIIAKNPLGQSLYGIDEIYSFFYDETNNIRKFWITENGLNAKPTNFVLGGICHRKSKSLSGIDELIKSLYIQQSATEIKFKHLASGSYLGVLNSKKIRTLLEWLIHNEIYIHYGTVNILYWSLVDIVDSQCADEKFRQYVPYVTEIKNELFNLANSDLSRFLIFLRKYRFPNVKRESLTDFMTELANLLETLASERQSEISKMTVRAVRLSIMSENMPFIVDNDDDVLIKSFKPFFLRPLMVYATSSHIFDNEFGIENEIKDIQIGLNGKRVEYSFLNSHDRFEIQLSDCICGLLGSHFNFLDRHTLSELKDIKKNLNQSQRQVLKLLANLIGISNTQSNGFIHRIAPNESERKNNYFLYGTDN